MEDGRETAKGTCNWLGKMSTLEGGREKRVLSRSGSRAQFSLLRISGSALLLLARPTKFDGIPLHYSSLFLH